MPQREQNLGRLALAVTLVTLALCWLVRESSWLEATELATRDARFRARHRLYGPPTEPSQVGLVVIDDRALEEIPTPLSLWSPIWTEVSERLIEAGATVVAPDQLWQLDPTQLATDQPEYEAVAERLLQTEFRFAALLGKHPIVLGSNLSRGVFHRPRPMLFALAGDRVALLNLEEQTDGVIRELLLGSQVAELDQFVPSLSWRTASLHAGLDPVALDALPQRDYRVNIDYTAPAGERFETVSVADIIHRPATADRFKGKAVLVGSYDHRLGDYHRTPYSYDGQPDMPGVEIHAHQVDTLLRKSFLVETPVWVRLLALLLAGMAGLGLGWLAKPWQMLLGLVCCLAFLGWAGLIFLVRFSLWLDLTGPTLGLLCSCLAVYTLRAITIERERNLALNRFGEMVSPQVMDYVLARPYTALQGEAREVTVLFVDINDFTTTCEQRRPDEVVEMLRDYFSLVVDIITERNGYVKQFVGDEVMAIFGAPEPCSDHADQAVHAALDLLSVLEASSKSGSPGFYKVKIGINTGEAVLGQVGSSTRWEYAAVGDEVNQGARAMQSTGQFGSAALVTESTRAAVSDESLEFVERGECVFKGRTQTTVLFEPRRKGRGALGD